MHRFSKNFPNSDLQVFQTVDLYKRFDRCIKINGHKRTYVIVVDWSQRLPTIKEQINVESVLNHKAINLIYFYEMPYYLFDRFDLAASEEAAFQMADDNMIFKGVPVSHMHTYSTFPAEIRIDGLIQLMWVDVWAFIARIDEGLLACQRANFKVVILRKKYNSVINFEDIEFKDNISLGFDAKGEELFKGFDPVPEADEVLKKLRAPILRKIIQQEFFEGRKTLFDQCMKVVELQYREKGNSEIASLVGVKQDGAQLHKYKTKIRQMYNGLFYTGVDEGLCRKVFATKGLISDCD